MPEKVKPQHQQRLAVVYIRQSSPGQVKNHRESYRVQKRIRNRAASLGWTWLTHWCAMHGTLLGDQHQVYDPALSQDSLVLGIQGVLAAHEIDSTPLW